MQIKSTFTALALGLAAIGACAQTVVGVSWSNFQEERWKTDEAAIKAQLEKLGAKYISADAGGSPEKQLGDIDGLHVILAFGCRPFRTQCRVLKVGQQLPAVAAANPRVTSACSSADKLDHSG